MIDFSVYLQSNHLNPEQPEKAYAKAQVRELMTFDKFVAHIAEHNAAYSRGTVKGVISDMCVCLVEMLIAGNKVEMGELGSFWISLSSEGAEDCKSFTVDHIKEVNIVFTPGTDFENLRSKAEFKLVTSRAVQAAALKAVKEGDDTLDLAALRKGSGSSNTPDEEPEKPDQPTDPDDGGNGGGLE